MIVYEHGARGRYQVTQEVMKVVVMGGYIKMDQNYKFGLPSVDIFSLIVNTWESYGETFTATTGTWTKGRIKFATISYSFNADVETVLFPATPLPYVQISEARAVPYEDTFLLVGGRRIFPNGGMEENAGIYKYIDLEPTPTTVWTELAGDGSSLIVSNPPTSFNGSWVKLPQKTRTPRYTGRWRSIH